MARLSPAQHRFAEMFAPLDGARLPGGCDSCDAEQSIATAGTPGVWKLTILHDDDCPVLARHERGRRKAARR